MNGRFFTVLLLLVAGLAVGCSNSTDALGSFDRPNGHTGRIALDWDGTYAGVLPCADCEGLETFVSLARDETFTFRTRYLGRDDRYFLRQGRFVWEEDGNVIQLLDVSDGAHRYHVGENRLFHLDRQGQRIIGDLADLYVLPKVAAGDEPSPHLLFAPEGWHLVDLLVEGLDTPELGDASMELPWMRLELSGMRVQGFAGCNRFTGGFAVHPGARLGFSSVGATKMACPDMRMETAFLDVLAETRAYQLHGHNLTLLGPDATPLARLQRAPR